MARERDVDTPSVRRGFMSLTRCNGPFGTVKFLHIAFVILLRLYVLTEAQNPLLVNLFVFFFGFVAVEDNGSQK